MANHRDPVPEWLTADYVQKFLRTSMNDSDLKIESIQIEPGSTVGDNYACQVFRIKLNLKSSKIDEKYLSIIGKVKPDTAMLRDMNVDMFDIEAKYFNLLQPKIIEVLKRTKTAREFFPKCFHVDNDKKIIFMEDLKYKQKLELQPRGKFLTLQQVELAVDALATLHATSISVVKENPEVVDIFNKHLWCEDVPTPIVKMFDNTSKAIERHIGSYKISEEWKKRLIGIRKRLEDGWLKIYERREGRLNVLVHGDCWLNNMMFRFTEKGADKVILIDYQLVNYTSFANDLQYLLFTSAESDVILENTDHLLIRYFEKFIEIAPDVPDLSLARIKSEFAEQYYFGYIMMIMVRPFIVAVEPPDLELILQEGKEDDISYNHPLYISDVEKLLPLFEKLGVH